jgi:hypothetical protein
MSDSQCLRIMLEAGKGFRVLFSGNITSFNLCLRPSYPVK